MASQKKVIKIKCEGTQYIDFHELNEFQEDIKSINQESLDKLKNSIKQGYKAPGFVWKYKNQYWILDMHQRKKALEQLENEGWIIPKVPVVEIFAKTKKEAKQNVLLYVSQHGEVDEKKLQIYIKKYEIKLNNIVIRKEKINLKNKDISKSIKKEILKPYKKVHILFSFHPDKMVKIKGYIEQIKNTEGVEYEQGEN